MYYETTFMTTNAAHSAAEAEGEEQRFSIAEWERLLTDRSGKSNRYSMVHERAGKGVLDDAMDKVRIGSKGATG